MSTFPPLTRKTRTASVFLRRGLAQTIDLDALIPQEPELQTYLFEEVQELVDYHHKKRLRQYQNVCRRYAGDGEHAFAPLCSPEA